MTEGVRLADQADQGILRGLRAAAAAEVGGHRGGAALLAEPLPVADGESTWLGTLDGHAVGFVTACWTTRASTRVGWLRQLWVEPDARGVGVGEALLSAALSWLAGLGVGRVDASALPGDRATKRALEAAGFAARLVVMAKDLP